MCHTQEWPPILAALLSRPCCPLTHKSASTPETINRNKMIFEVMSEAPESGYEDRALGHDIFTQGEGGDDLTSMVWDVVTATSLMTMPLG